MSTFLKGYKMGFFNQPGKMGALLSPIALRSRSKILLPGRVLMTLPMLSVFPFFRFPLELTDSSAFVVLL